MNRSTNESSADDVMIIEESESLSPRPSATPESEQMHFNCMLNNNRFDSSYADHKVNDQQTTTSQMTNLVNGMSGVSLNGAVETATATATAKGVISVTAAGSSHIGRHLTISSITTRERQRLTPAINRQRTKRNPLNSSPQIKLSAIHLLKGLSDDMETSRNMDKLFINQLQMIHGMMNKQVDEIGQVLNMIVESYNERYHRSTSNYSVILNFDRHKCPVDANANGSNFPLNLSANKKKTVDKNFNIDKKSVQTENFQDTKEL